MSYRVSSWICVEVHEYDVFTYLLLTLLKGSSCRIFGFQVLRQYSHNFYFLTIGQISNSTKMSGDNSNTPSANRGEEEWGTGPQDMSWHIPEFERRRVERMVRKVLGANGIYANELINHVGGFVGGRLRGWHRASAWSLPDYMWTSGWRAGRRNPDNNE